GRACPRADVRPFLLGRNISAISATAWAPKRRVTVRPAGAARARRKSAPIATVSREVPMENAAQPPEQPARAKRPPAPKGQCAITGRERSRRELVMLSTLRPNLVERIHRDYPDLPGEALVSRTEVERYRTLYVEEILKHERGDLSALDKQVAESLAKHETL